MEQNVTHPSGETRRDFIKKSATVAAAAAATNILRVPVYGQSTAPSAGRTIGANDRIVVGYIGLGGQGMLHLTNMRTHASDFNVTQAGVCDLWTKRLDAAKAAAGQGNSKVEAYEDYRKMLENKDIDAVVIATHDVWHAQPAIDALTAGKHVYVEKPLTRYLDEGFAVYDTVKKTGKILQVGSQGCSAAAWHKAAEFIRAGKIGPLVWAQGYYCRNLPSGEWNYEIDSQATAQTVKWDTWLGKVKKRVPFDGDHFFRWRKYYPYCGGLLSDLVPHRLHPLMLATGEPQFPTRVVSIGTRSVLSDRKKTPKTYDRDVPEHVELLAEFPNGLIMLVAASSVAAKSPGFVIYGHQASLNIGDAGNKLELIPEKPYSEELDIESLEGLKPSEDIVVHEKNWLDCIRTNKQPNANIDLAMKVQTVVSLAEVSERMKVAALFDEKTRKVTTGEGKELPPLTYGSLPLS